ncbi:outer membrane lipoprotein LolB [Nitrosomonas sp. Nm51]|uniref:lipoprotein insertase outer membrane protein LolB n=1 Tax=Nitrosomonas sp. Nm51 TaxID=133720 RepID=UPI0008C23FBC|nr:lipoprotein insertase outer membrane protein LolB [Nitrosomonas sp. Nm51]SER57494.1 outer membrane lipoprotein LolB [Nitrosomonas sp. Nm51]
MLFLFLPMLVGCAALTTQTTLTTQVARTVVFEPLAALNVPMAGSFELLGRVSVRNEHQRFSGNVHWQHTRFEDMVLLLSPLGQAVAEIVRNHDGVSLTTAKQETFYAGNVEDLTAELLGWRLPLNGLQYWVQGLHSPLSQASVDYDSENRVIAIRQDGWEIMFTQYFKDDAKLSDKPVAHPRIFELRIEDLNIRMVVDKWIEA